MEPKIEHTCRCGRGIFWDGLKWDHVFCHEAIPMPERVPSSPAARWAHIPAQYKSGRWAVDYDDKNSVFFVHCNGHRVCEAEDSEVSVAICSVYNAGSPAASTPATEWPEIPPHVTDPIVFRDKNLGVCLLANQSGSQWVYRVHDGHWCSVRKVNAADPLFVAPLNRPTPCSAASLDVLGYCSLPGHDGDPAHAKMKDCEDWRPRDSCTSASPCGDMVAKGVCDTDGPEPIHQEMPESCENWRHTHNVCLGCGREEPV